MTTVEDLFGARTAVLEEFRVDAAVRARLEHGYTRYALLDRGSYDVAEPDEPALTAALIARAERTTGRSLVVDGARALRLQPGDYVLAHHDRFHTGHPVELTLDLSAAALPGAEVHYRRRGQVYFRVPTVPHTLAIVERGPTVNCNHTYVSRRHTTAAVRLVLLLRDR